MLQQETQQQGIDALSKQAGIDSAHLAMLYGQSTQPGATVPAIGTTLTQSGLTLPDALKAVVGGRNLG